MRPAHRGSGIGKALLDATWRGSRSSAAAAASNGACSTGTTNAIRFYRGLGATVMPDWRICRISGEALERFAVPA